jgi:hypothetical protein
MSPSHPLAPLERHTLVPLALFLALALPATAQTGPAELQLQADAGPDRVVAWPASVVLAGSVHGLKNSSLDPQPGFLSWSQVSGPPLAILGRDTLAPTVLPSQPGTYRLRLEAQHPAVGSDTDEVLVTFSGTGQDVTLSGEPRLWHTLTLTFRHDQVLSEAGTPNPFLDLRLVAHFQHESGRLVSVPGFFAADGVAAESGATAGNCWRVHFTPDRTGIWNYTTSFRAGSQIALDPDPAAGQPVSFDGTSGAFTIEPADPRDPGFLSRGRLEYVGRHHLQFAETGEAFLTNGAGSPENFFGYHEFDNTFDQGGAPNDLNVAGGLDGLHHYDAHLADYVDLGVPLWNGKGRAIFGAISYLAARGVNSLYALSYNIDGGDGREVWPWTPADDKLRFDVSKLAQWERVVDHMTRAGIAWHVMTQETENEFVLDSGTLGVQRKLYYRELVARFAHALGLVWNLGEENDNRPEDRMDFTDYIRALDPYDHPIALHNHSGDLTGAYGALLGSHLELATLQSDLFSIPFDVQTLVDESEIAARPWTVNFSEQGPANDGAVPDAVDFWHDSIRKEGLWPTLLGGGGGCEWYFGYAHPNNDLDCEDFRSRDNLWLLSARALDFLRDHVPFDEMEHADLLTNLSGPSVLAKRGEFYLVYLPFGGPVSLDFGNEVGPFLVSWFNARDGGALQAGAVTQVSGPGFRALGSPPAAGDWVAFVRRAANLPPVIEGLTLPSNPFFEGDDFSLQVRARDPNGPADTLHATLRLTDPNGKRLTLALPYRGGGLYSVFFENAAVPVPGTWQVRVTVRDASGLSAIRFASYVAQ